MSSDQEPASDRLSLIEQRLVRIEEALGLGERVSGPATAGVQMNPPLAPPSVPEPVPSGVVVRSAIVQLAPPTKPTRASAGKSPATALRSISSAASGSAAAKGMSLESLIGGRFFAAVGALVVVIAIAMFLKLGIDRGWFAMSPTLRCLAAGGFGLALLVAGEALRRRVNA